jgi:hypothetical protein
VFIEFSGFNGLCTMNYYTDVKKSFVSPNRQHLSCNFKSCRVQYVYHYNDQYHKLFHCTKDRVIDVSRLVITISYGKFIIGELRNHPVVHVNLSDWKQYSLYFYFLEDDPWYVLYCNNEYIKPCPGIFKCTKTENCTLQFGYYEVLFSLKQHCQGITGYLKTSDIK